MMYVCIYHLSIIRLAIYYLSVIYPSIICLFVCLSIYL
jgi:hypothetical protein